VALWFGILGQVATSLSLCLTLLLQANNIRMRFHVIINGDQDSHVVMSPCSLAGGSKLSEENTALTLD
jgi:hypothetical protein